MDRKDFLKQVGMVGAAVGLGLISSPDLFQHPLHNYYEQLRRNAKSISVYELESIIAARALLFGNEEQELEDWKNHVLETSEAGKRINDVRQNLAEMSVSKAKQFRDEKPEKSEVDSLFSDFNKRYEIINEIKKSYTLYFSEQQGETFLIGNPSAPIYQIIKGTPLANVFGVPDLEEHVKKLEISSEKKKDIRKLIETLNNLSPHALFIARTARSAGISLEDAVAFAHMESRGREFVLSNTATGMLQVNFNPRVLKYNYPNAISRDNEVSEYIRKNSSKDTIFEDLNSKPYLNISIGINLVDFKKEKVKEYYAAAYYTGIEDVGDLPKSIKYKLRNPRKITERDLSHHSRYKYLLRYQNGFWKSKDNFAILRGSRTPDRQA